MSIDYSKVTNLAIPEGNVTKITRNLDGVTLFELSKFPQKDTLENMSWEDISIVCKAGLAAEYWAVGDQKTISMDGTSYAVDIIGFDHDVPANTTAYGRTNAGITFQLHEIYNTSYQMHTSTLNKFGWHECYMRTSVMTTLYNKLPVELRNVIVKVNKNAGYDAVGKRTIKTSSDSLFLLAETEVLGAEKYAVSGEGSQYTYYKNGGNTVKNINGTKRVWWLRSLSESDSDGFCSITTVGKSNVYGNTSKLWVSFAFCV